MTCHVCVAVRKCGWNGTVRTVKRGWRWFDAGEAVDGARAGVNILAGLARLSPAGP